MMLLTTPYKGLIACVLASGIATGMWLELANTVSLDDIQYKKGTIESATCIDSRSVRGIRVVATYSNGPVEDYVALPVGIECSPSLTSQIRGEVIKVAYYEAHSFGVSVGSHELRDTATEIARFNDRSRSIIFVAFVTVVAVCAIYFRGRNASTAIVREGT
jgi:hypothetical protein